MRKTESGKWKVESGWCVGCHCEPAEGGRSNLMRLLRRPATFGGETPRNDSMVHHSLAMTAIALLFFVFPFSTLHFPLSVVNAEQNSPAADFITLARQAMDQQKFDEAVQYTKACIEQFQEQAVMEQSSLQKFPSVEERTKYQALNDVGTAYFIQGETYLKKGKKDEAKRAFQTVIEKYSYSQWWDPRGWYVRAAEESRYKLEKMEGGKWKVESGRKTESGEWRVESGKNKVSFVFPTLHPPPSTFLTLADYGTEKIADYTKYGEFLSVGTENYHYRILDPKGLAEAVGEGIYPNTRSVLEDPEYRKLLEQGRLEGDHWDFVNSDDLAAAFYKWATVTTENRGVKLFYTGHILEKAGLIEHAIKAYYAIIVHFPDAVGWTYWNTPWYVGSAAMDRIQYLCRAHPELGLALEGTRIRLINGFDGDITNDQFIVEPGKLVKIGPRKAKARAKTKYKPQKKIKKTKLKQIRSQGVVELVQLANGDWQLMVEGKPFLIKAVSYTPTKIGQSPDDETLKDWSTQDENQNGLIDAAYESWVDKNGNNVQDPDEPAVGDFQLLKEMGANTIRIYHHGLVANQSLLRELYRRYGIRVIMGDFLGAYTVGSGASWYDGTDYRNSEQKKRMLESVQKMVQAHKDEPYLLMWMLGNENNYGVANNAKQFPEDYYTFVNEVAGWIKQTDPLHPVAICNGDVLYLDRFAKLCPNVDVFGVNAYRGKYGFGFWSGVKELADRAVLVTEYGCPGYAKGKDREWAQERQAEYHQGCWMDILANSVGNGSGNAVGGVIFEWIDEWWKSYDPLFHDTKPNYSGPYPDGWMYEEWLGIVGQGDGSKSPFLRELRAAYFMYKKAWGKEG